MAISSEVDIYDPDSPEVLLFDDAIGVKKQKENRDKIDKKEIDESENISKASRKFIITDVILLEKPSGGFKYITSPIDAQGKPLIPLEEMVKYQINYYYENYKALGRVEKAVDLVIGYRQKRKGMSWSSLGSKALAILKVVELNGEWQQFWFPETVI